MSIQQLQITNLRNIATLMLDCHSHINVIYGHNGSGKTSILEALYMLSLGKSFRSHLKSRLIQYDKSSLTVFAKVKTTNGKLCPLGLEKSQDNSTRLKFNNEVIESIAKFANVLPIQLLHPHSYQLLEDGSKPRRQFIDWGMFHVEHLFLELWNNSQRLLKQRNAALKYKLPSDEITMWDQDFAGIAEALNEMRSSYVGQLLPIFQETLKAMTNLPEIAARYCAGWNLERGLTSQLAERVTADRALGYTSIGPHRADLKLYVGGMPVQDILSRGQQKLIVFALRFAQAKLLERDTDKKAIFLIDDMPSELDHIHQRRLFDLIADMSHSSQFFLTGVHKKSFENLENAKMFHVEHGAILEKDIAY